jgi:hypothetical protein
MDIFLKRTQTVLKDIQRGETDARRDRAEGIGASGSPTPWHSRNNYRVPDYWMRGHGRVPGTARHDYSVRLTPGKDEPDSERPKDIDSGDEVILG